MTTRKQYKEKDLQLLGLLPRVKRRRTGSAGAEPTTDDKAKISRKRRVSDNKTLENKIRAKSVDSDVNNAIQELCEPFSDLTLGSNSSTEEVIVPETPVITIDKLALKKKRFVVTKSKSGGKGLAVGRRRGRNWRCEAWAR